MSRPRPETIEQIQRIRQLHDEGMPSSWIAEDVGLRPSQVRRIAGPSSGATEWRRCWALIRRDADLFALHQSLAPKLPAA